MFDAGVSVTEPDDSGLVVTVRPPSVVIVTDEALEVCHVIVTFCPDEIEPGLTVNFVTCGVAADTVTFAVAGVLEPPGPVAVAVYIVVDVGESLTVPDSWELVVKVRIAVPAVAVIVTELAFDDCHFSVTLWPLVIDAESTDNDTVGIVGGEAFDVPAQDDNPQMARSTIPQDMQRTALEFMMYKRPTSRHGAAIQMPRRPALVVETL